MNQEQSFKINIALGFVLINVETGELRYFVPHQNNTILDQPRRIDLPSDLLALIQEISVIDLLGNICGHRESTKWKPLIITNTCIYLYHLNVTMGKGTLPQFIKDKRSIISLDIHPHQNLPYNDNMCSVRALAYHLNIKNGLAGHHELERKTSELQSRWNKDGLRLQDIPEFESCFHINLDVFSLTEEGGVVPRYLSPKHYDENITMNLFDCHLCLVVNVPAYLGKFQCSSCNQHFENIHIWKRHQGSCENATSYIFPGNYYHLPHSVFDNLEEYGIIIPNIDKFFDWFAVFDCEALLTPANGDDDNVKLKWSHKHSVISVSVCSNIEGYQQPYCIVNPNSHELVQNLIEYLNRISEISYNLAKKKLCHAFDALDQLILKWKNYTPEPNETDDIEYDAEDGVESEGEDEGENPDKKWKSENPQELTLNWLQTLRKFIDLYCHQFPVLGFNSSRYDLNLLKRDILQVLQQQSDNNVHVIKKLNQYSSISTPTLKFLDMVNFVSPGYSYAKFLKAFGVEERKSYFPYEFLDDVSKLSDGFNAATNTVFEFNGCYWHGHDCTIKPNMRHEALELQIKRQQRTASREKFLRNQGYALESIYECEFNQLLKEDPELHRFSQERFPKFYRHHQGRVDEDTILSAVKYDDVFGIVEVDISIPEDRYNEFKEIAPIFCTTEVQSDHFGNHMQQHIQHHDHLSKKASQAFSWRHECHENMPGFATVKMVP